MLVHFDKNAVHVARWEVAWKTAAEQCREQIPEYLSENYFYLIARHVIIKMNRTFQIKKSIS